MVLKVEQLALGKLVRWWDRLNEPCLGGGSAGLMAMLKANRLLFVKHKLPMEKECDLKVVAFDH